MHHPPFSTRILLTLALFLSGPIGLMAQDSDDDWISLPGLEHDSPLTVTDQAAYLRGLAAAAASYVLAEFILPKQDQAFFYQARVGMNKEDYWGLKSVYHQNVGVELRLASWFTVGLEPFVQEWSDRTPGISRAEEGGMGVGIMHYYRWNLMGGRRVSPYLEYGSGLFFGFEKFPYTGTAFTFNHSSQVGVEVRLGGNYRLRVGYGNYHQSNNNWLDPNPGYNADGFDITLSKFWRPRG